MILRGAALLVAFAHLVVVVKANCLTGSIRCHEAASCQNVSGTPTCVCDPWHIGDGITNCYGFCNRTCGFGGSSDSCRTNALGYTCLCESPSADCPEPPPPPFNIRVTWKSSTAITFAWDYVRNAYLYEAYLQNSTWRSRTYSTSVPIAGFGGLAPSSSYDFYVNSTESNSRENSGTVKMGILTAGSSPPNAELYCDQPQGCQADVNECTLGTHRCHTEASCFDTRNGYRCSCNNGYVGNGTHCVGICGPGQCPDGNCFPNQFGSTCFCRSQTPQCRVPEPPTGIRLTMQTESSLAFEWNSSRNVASYRVTLTSNQHPGFRSEIYLTDIPSAAYTGLLSETEYNVQVYASNARGRNPTALTLFASTASDRAPELSVVQETSTSIRVAITPVSRAVSYDVEYYTDPSAKSLLNTAETSVFLDNLQSQMEYNVQVYANYDFGRSKGSNISSVFLVELCGRRVCHSNASCNSRNRCECDDGFVGSGTECREVYEIPFRIKLAPNNLTNEMVRIELLATFISREAMDLSVIETNNGFVRFNVFTFNPNFTFGNAQHNNDAFDGNPQSLRDVCISTQLEVYNFRNTTAGSVQFSTEICSDGTPIASVFCASQVVQTRDSFLLESQFVESNLTTIICPIIGDLSYNLSSVDVEVPFEAIQQALDQLNISGITPNITVTQGEEVISAMFPSQFNVDLVITIDIGENTTIENLERPVRITNVLEETKYGQTERLTALVDTRVVQKCVFWDEEALVWSGEGCCLNNYIFPPTCECNHLTSFAIIVSTVEVPANLALVVVSDIGTALSIIGLAATFLILILNREARVKIPNIIQMHFTCTLFLTYVIFLAGVTKVEYPAICTFIAALLQYVFLVSWVWIAIYSNRLYVALSNVFHQTGPNFIKKACLFAYGIPLLIVGFNVGITIGYFDRNQRNEELCNPDDPITTTSYYRASNMCWLQNFSLYYGFLIIVGIVLLHNMVVLVWVSMKLFKKQSIRSTRAKRNKFSDLLSAIGLSFTLGVTWLFGFLMLLSRDVTYNLIMSWLFAIFTATQGFAIWYVTCVKRDDNREFWWHPIKHFFIASFTKLGCFKATEKHVSVNSTGASVSTTTYLKNESL